MPLVSLPALRSRNIRSRVLSDGVAPPKRWNYIARHVVPSHSGPSVAGVKSTFVLSFDSRMDDFYDDDGYGVMDSLGGRRLRLVAV